MQSNYITGVTEQQKLWFHAGESYARLAARLNADPVQLAEADVLGLLWDLYHHPAGSSLWLMANAALQDTLEQCRQTEPKP